MSDKTETCPRVPNLNLMLRERKVEILCGPVVSSKLRKG